MVHPTLLGDPIKPTYDISQQDYLVQYSGTIEWLSNEMVDKF